MHPAASAFAVAKRVAGMNGWIVSANDLVVGTVVYYAADGWSGDIGDAAVAADRIAAKKLLAASESAVRDNRVVEPYLVEVELCRGKLSPLRLREQLRHRGPSVAQAGG